jgi:hypothetical protein
MYQYEAPRRHLYFDVVVGLARSHDPESYAGGSLLLVGSPKPDRSKAMTQTKRDVQPSKGGITLIRVYVMEEMPTLGRHRLISCEP